MLPRPGGEGTVGGPAADCSAAIAFASVQPQFREVKRLSACPIVLIAMLATACSREPGAERIAEALAECGASQHARIHEGRHDGESALVVDFDTEGAELDEQMRCVAARIEAAGFAAPTMGGGTGRFTRSEEEAPLRNAPSVNAASRPGSR